MEMFMSPKGTSDAGAYLSKILSYAGAGAKRRGHVFYDLSCVELRTGSPCHDGQVEGVRAFICGEILFSQPNLAYTHRQAELAE